MKRILTSEDIALLLAISPRRVRQRAKEDKWSYCTQSVQGGKQKRFHLKDLPEDVQVAYAVSLNLSLEGLQGEIKPAPKVEVKVSIDGYKCRSGSAKTYKDITQCTEAELDIARNRQKIIAAYERAKQEGLNCEEFVSFYNMDKVLPDVKAVLGRWGELKNWRRFYVWLKAYTQAGLAGLVPQYKKRGGAGSSLAPEV
ncbi:MAG: hypothetical protein LBG87_08260, partial [Spirochaetaceae bacterium]|nr:hypothetical protein [Spirochaetaceae bacterium]